MSDYSEMEKVQRRMENAVREIRNLTAAVGHAKQIREYDSDRRKALLARFALPHLKAGKSVGAAEMIARADPAYQSELEAISGQREASETTIASWEAAFAAFEASRSLNSSLKETMRTLE